MKYILIFIFTIIYSVSFPQSDKVITIGNVKEVKKSVNGVSLKTENALVDVLVYSPGVIRVRIDNKEFGDDFSYAVIQNPASGFKEFNETETEIEMSTDSVRVVIKKKPFCVEFSRPDGQILNEDYPAFPVTWQGTEVTCFKKLFADEKFIGLGE